MADDDTQPVQQPSSGDAGGSGTVSTGGIWPSSAPADVPEEPRPAPKVARDAPSTPGSGSDNDAADIDDEPEERTYQRPKDVMDFLVGINTDKVLNESFYAIENTVNHVWTELAAAVHKGVVGDKGAPADLPPPENRGGKGRRGH